MVVTIGALAWDRGTLPWGMVLVVPFVVLVLGWLVGLVVVLPILVRWPRWRQPTVVRSAAVGVLVAWGVEGVAGILSGRWDTWLAWLFVTLAGAAAGVSYAVAAMDKPGASRRARGHE
jgi:hypothetical protein